MKTSSPAAALIGTILMATDGCKRDKKRAYYLVSLAAERDAVIFSQTAEKEVLSHSQSYQIKSIGVTFTSWAVLTVGLQIVMLHAEFCFTNLCWTACAPQVGKIQLRDVLSGWTASHRS